MDEEYGLIVSFPDQSQAFTLGVEAGMFWQRLESGEREFEVSTRVENREVIARMAGAQNVVSEVIASGVEGWDYTRVHGRPDRPKLRLVRGGLLDTKSLDPS